MKEGMIMMFVLALRTVIQRRRCRKNVLDASAFAHMLLWVQVITLEIFFIACQIKDADNSEILVKGSAHQILLTCHAEVHSHSGGFGFL